MTAKQVAKRYAKALIEVLQEKDALAHADAFLAFSRLARDNDELMRLFADFQISSKDKATVVAALGARLELPEMTCNFNRVLAENNRLDILTEVAQEVAKKLDAVRNIQEVCLTTAAQASRDELTQFQTAVKKQLGTEVRVETLTDPSIIGGAIAQIGSLVYDGSVRAQLNRLHRELIKET